MTATATVKFKERMTYEKFSDAVTIFEEAFALLILENNFDRWIYMAKKQMKNETSTNVNGSDCDGTSTSDGSRDELDGIIDEEKVPDVLYQVKVRQRKDKIDTAGKWTKEGMERVNELITMVQDGRNSVTREQFDIQLQNKYVCYADENNERRNRYKRKRELEEMASESNKSVVVKNVLNIVAL